MEDNSLSNTSNTVESKKKETNKERPKSLDLESQDYSNEEEDTSKKAKDLASSQEDFLSSRSAEPESPDEGDDASQRSSSRSKSIASSLKSKIRDLSPSRRAGTPTAERKTSKAKSPSKLSKSPGNWLPASFNQIFSSYKTKCGDFRRLFKDLPDSEQLIVDYSCALQRDILVHGRLYISQNWLCFYANIFGWETFVTVQCTEISSIRKEKTALVIPNAIQICTESEKYFFASFISRDTAYTVLFRIWQNALLDQPLSPSELIQMVGKYSEPQHNASSDNDDSEEEEKQVLSDSEIDSDNDQELNSDSISSLSQGQNEMANENISTENQDGASPSREDGAPAVAAERQSQQAPPSPRKDLKNFLKSPKPKRKVTVGLENSQPPNEREGEGSSGLDEEGTASDFHDDEVTEVPVNCPCDSHMTREFINEEFPVVVDTLYEYLFTESDFYKRVQKARRTKDLLFKSWEKTEDGQRRTITYTVSLNHAIGPKHSSTTEQQHCLLGSIPGGVYVVQAEVSNEGIPYGDSFSVVNRYCITRSSSMTSRLRITSEIKYHKSVWGFVKNMIEKNANEALESYFQFLAESLRTETTQGQWPAKKRKGSTIRRHKRTRSLKNKEEVTPTSESFTVAQSTLLQRLSSRAAMSSLLGVRLRFPQIKVENRLAVAVTILLGALLILNMVLVYRMLLLEQAAYTRVRWDGTLQDLPTDASEWAKLLQQQRNVQGIEMKRWRDVLTSSIELMNQVQKSLDALQEELSREQTTGAVSPT